MKNILHRFKLKRARRNEIESAWLRDFYRESYGIDVGLYSYGCFDINRIPRNTKIGRYCSFASSCCFLNGNHGVDFLSLHPYLYNTTLKLVEKETIRRTRFVIEDDVWVGHNAIVLPSVTHIGRGAVIGAGAVVTRDVGPYEIVAGNPARRIRMRFDSATIDRVEATRWWEMSKEELAALIVKKPELVFSPANYFLFSKSMDRHEPQ